MGTVYFNEDGIVNIFALKDLIGKHRVRNDSKKEDAFNRQFKNYYSAGDVRNLWTGLYGECL